MSDIESLSWQIKTILLKYTRSSRVDMMVEEIMDAIKRDSPKIQVAVPIEPCMHLYKLERIKGCLTCKRCGRIKDLKHTQHEGG